MKEYSILDWDSEFFGIRVAAIHPPVLDKEHLQSVTEALKREGVSLAYWASDSASSESKKAGISVGGFLADRKTTYFFDLGNLENEQIQGTHPIVEYEDCTPSDELEQLAIQSGEYSRFNVDSRIPTERFNELYRLWIQKSVSKEMADVVMVINNDDHKVVGMVTLGEQNGRGDIGLIAVDSRQRGKGYGRALLRSAMDYFSFRGYEHAQVVTQGDNVPACRLYEQAGYNVEKCENFFHFWLT